MTKSTITREESIQAVFDLKVGYPLGLADIEILKRVARIALAAMDSESGCLPLDYLQGHKDGLEWAAQLAEANHPETGDWLYDDPIELAKAIRKGPDMPPAQPVADSEPDRNPVLAYADSYRDMAKQGVESVPIWSVITDLERNIAPLYRHAQPAPERDRVRCEHAEWSQATFGNVGPIGPLKHLSKEALEAAAEPGDLSEWADIQFLLWDAQRRAGIADEQITQAMIEKLAVNKQREWPEPKDGEPRLHIKAQPTPVVPEEVTDEDCPALVKYDVTEVDEAWARGFNACRSAMLATAPQLPGSEPATVTGKWILVSERMPIEFEAVIAFDGDQVYGEAMHSSDDGFTIDGYEPCDRLNLQNVTHWMPLPAAPQEVQGE
ncbi:TPA: dATP/dGTP pyrophosphohydrolase domain-containing protein [Klebsiella quasipneumoniae]